MLYIVEIKRDWEENMQEKALTISVVIPTFREGKYIAATLSRLVNVNPPIEIIVVDGGSEDNTVDVARRFTDNIYQIRERGISKARNYGGMRASGDILVFLDADVDPPSDFAEKVVKTFDDATVVGATCRIMPAKPRPIEFIFFQFYNFIIKICASFKPYSRGEFFAVRKSIFVEVGGFDETMPCLEDHDLAHRLSKRGKFTFIKGLTVYESMRRFRKLGFLRVIGTWFTDYISFVLWGKPLSGVWQPLR